jgi:ADP-ribosylation factor 2-binding protein
MTILLNFILYLFIDIFDNSEENKIEYTPIFSEYTRVIEGVLENRLKSKISGFDMKRFENMLVDRQSNN